MVTAERTRGYGTPGCVTLIKYEYISTYTSIRQQDSTLVCQRPQYILIIKHVVATIPTGMIPKDDLVTTIHIVFKILNLRAGTSNKLEFTDQ
jgi:hypothetical protein